MISNQLSSQDTGWFKSSHSSDNAACVEVRVGRGAVGVRDSKDRTGPALAFTPTAWTSFLANLNRQP